MGTDGNGLSCPGSSVVAEGNAELGPLIKSPVEKLPQDTHQEQSQAT
jgi:hypothetical protein